MNRDKYVKTAGKVSSIYCLLFYFGKKPFDLTQEVFFPLVKMIRSCTDNISKGGECHE